MPVLIFDAHLDLAFNGVDWNRDLRMAIAEIRAQEATLKMTEPGRRTNTVSFPELRAGEVRLGVATLFARQEQAINHPFGCTTPEACYATAMSHLHYYRAMERVRVDALHPQPRRLEGTSQRLHHRPRQAHPSATS